MEKRYFYYLFAINQIANIGMFVPAILYETRHGGAVNSMLLAVLLGTALMGGYLYLSARLPLATLPEQLDMYAPRWIKVPCMLLIIGMWYWIGLIALLSFVKITQRFISPGSPEYIILTVYLVVVWLAARISSRSILLGLEILLFINVPVFFFFITKALLSTYINWTGAVEMATYLHHLPTYKGVSSASFVFSGYANMVVFQKVFAKPVDFKHFWILPLWGFSSLLIGYFMPILFHGTAAIEQYKFPWISTADSVRMELFVVERMLFVFLFVYISISLVSIMVHWHVSHITLSHMTTRLDKRLKRGKSKIPWMAIAEGVLFSGGAYVLLPRINIEGIIHQSGLFMVTRFTAEIVLLAIIADMVRRRRKAE
jgi:hypothetical protein